IGTGQCGPRTTASPNPKLYDLSLARGEGLIKPWHIGEARDNMRLKVGIDFGTSNSGVAIYRGDKVHVLPIDGKNLVPEVVKTILYITRDYRHFIGQEAVELYYKQNINRQRRFVKKWSGEIDYRGSDMHYVRDIYVYVDELQPDRKSTRLNSSHGYISYAVFCFETIT